MGCDADADSKIDQEIYSYSELTVKPYNTMLTLLAIAVLYI
jgi:hypothetical protein